MIPMIPSSYSHVPIITLLPLLLPIKRVLECGSGVISTPIFCDKTIYPDMEQFDSLENGSLNYANRTCAAMGDHLFIHKLHYTPGKMAEIINDYDINQYDLILIDDSDSVEARSQTIFNITSRAHHPILLIHDFEQPSYHHAVQLDFQKFIFDDFEPHTGVFWKQSALVSNEYALLEALAARKAGILKEFSNYLGAADLWRRYFLSTESISA